MTGYVLSSSIMSANPTLQAIEAAACSLGKLFATDELHSGYLRIQTPLYHTDGTGIDVYYKDGILTDMGTTYNLCVIAGHHFGAAPIDHFDKLVGLECDTYGVQCKDGVITTHAADAAVLFEHVIMLAQACAAAYTYCRFE